MVLEEKTTMKGKLAPSMMCANFLNLEKEIQAFEALNIDYLHIDIMDGSFVPNITLGTDYVKKLKEVTRIPLDIHLMIDRPEDKLAWFDFRENDYVSFHYEATRHTHRVIHEIKGRKAKVMLALNPGTSTSVLEEVIHDLDGVLIMSVNPGFAGQKLIKQTIDKIKRVRMMYPHIDIEVDGNVNFENAVKMREAGANIFVSGSSGIFEKNGTLADNAQRLRKCIE